VVDPTAGISDSVLINDAHLMWISPGGDGSSPTSHAYVYSRASRPGLGRYLKVVGRNLSSAPGARTTVRLEPITLPLERAGSESGVAPNDGGPIDLFADADADAATAIEHFVAKVSLPKVLPAGDYVVKVSRDGVSWVPVDPDPILQVRPGPSPRGPGATRNT
jgi:hypothetical protein